MKSIQFFLASFLFVALSISTNAQDYAGDFSWVSTSPSTNSATGAAACGIQNVIELGSSTTHVRTGGSSVLFPSSSSDPATSVTITLKFNAPVCNLRLKINDLDYGPATSSTPVETISAVPAFGTVSPSVSPAGPVFNNVAGVLQAPFNVNNTLGWVEFTVPSLSTVVFTYTRKPGYNITFDSIMYDCCESCICDSKDNKLIGATGSIPSSGLASVNLNASSNGVAIKKLNISLPHYQSLANPDCIKCDPANISNNGKIMNLPTIAGVTPTFTGPSTSGAAEIVYEFAVPTVINHTVSLDIQFPPTLALSCCPNKVDYCIKLGMIDEKCNICEKLLCLNSSSSGSSSSSGGSSRNATISRPRVVADQIGESTSLNDFKLLLTPNPTTEMLNVTFPSDEKGTVEILDLNGKRIQTLQVSSKAADIDVSKLSSGTYIITYRSGESTLSERFVKTNL